MKIFKQMNIISKDFHQLCQEMIVIRWFLVFQDNYSADYIAVNT